jgi:MGT family glycosyltransferase
MLIESERITWHPIGTAEFPEGSFEKHWGPLMRRRGIGVTLRTILIHAKIAAMMCREVPDLVKKLNMDVLLIDQLQYQGAAIAGASECPFITIACAMHVNRSSKNPIPSPFVPWPYKKQSVPDFFRNKLSWFFFDRLSALILNKGNQLIGKGGLKRIKRVEESFSRLAQIVPMPRNLDWQVSYDHGSLMHYFGSLVDDFEAGSTWKKPVDDSRPLVYVSLGTLQCANRGLLKTIDAALARCSINAIFGAGNWQHVKRSQDDFDALQVLDYAPQKKILKHVSLCITHGGMNTVIEALFYGVPLIVLPITNDQPGIAQRVSHAGVGVVENVKTISVERMETAIISVLQSNEIRSRVVQMQKSIRESGGVVKAAEYVEAVCYRFLEKTKN